MTEIKFETEINFAREFYSKAVEGLEPHEYPPTPDVWLENPDVYMDSWKHMKLELIGMAEAEKTPIERKEDVTAFLKCTLSIYLDLMCSICETFIDEVKPGDEAKPLDLKATRVIELSNDNEITVV